MNLRSSHASYSIDLTTTMSPTNYDDMAKKQFESALDIQSGNLRDIDYFIPLAENLEMVSDRALDNNFSMKTSFSIIPGMITIDRFDLHYLTSTEINLNGQINNITGNENINLDLDIHQLALSRMDIDHTLKEPLPESSFPLPDLIEVRGKYKGDGVSNDFRGNLRSALGHANIDIEGHFTGNDLFQGKGYVDLTVNQLELNDYTCQDIEIAGELDDGQITLDVNSSDTNLIFDAFLAGTLAPEACAFELALDLEHIDLDTLNLLTDKSDFSGKAGLKINYSESQGFSLLGSLKDLEAHYEDTLYCLDSAYLALETGDQGSRIDLRSGNNYLEFSCKSDLQEFFLALNKLPSYYIKTDDPDSSGTFLPEFSLEAKIEYPGSFAKQFFPGYPGFEQLIVSGRYEGSTDRLSLNASIPGTYYAGVSADSLQIVVAGSSKVLAYEILSGLNVGDMLKGHVDFTGEIKNGVLASRLIYSDSYGEPYLDLTSRIEEEDDRIILHIYPDPLIFSYDAWDIHDDNRVTLNSSSISFQNFIITGGEQQIALISPDAEALQSIRLKMTGFNLGSMEHLLALDTLTSGTASADISIDNIMTAAGIEGTLKIENLELFDFELGELYISSLSFHENRAAFNLSLKGPKEDISLSGSWDGSREKKTMGLDVDIHSLNLAELNYLLSDYVTDAKGSLEGKIQVTGSPDLPVVNGKLVFSDAGAGINLLNNYFTFGNETITITDNIIDFGSLSVVNQQDQAARISGTVSLDPGGRVHHDLRISTDNMVLMNSTRENNDMLFGLLKMQTDFGINGTMEETKISATAKIDEKTDITYIFPESLALDDNSGTVEFVDFNADSVRQNRIAGDRGFLGQVSFKNIRTTIDMSKGAHIRILFDQGGSDYLDARLLGLINYNLAEGNTEVSGMLEIESGKLNYGIPMVSAEGACAAHYYYGRFRTSNL
ncbi:MAG: translocation/assembly module TamB domain-containing protein [Bacteroidales bacterium]|nr:translocation/assembly module TamB domain-containing protein [Bacteroidales bacterium]